MNDLIHQTTEQATDFRVWTFVDAYWPQLLMAAAGVGALWIVLRMILRTRSKHNVSSETHRPERNLTGEKGLFGWITPALAAQIPESEKESREFSDLLRQAGIYAPAAAASLYALRFVLLFGTLVVAAVVALLMPAPYMWPTLIIGVILAGGLSVAPRLFVFFRRRARQREIRHGLADMMDMLSMCIGGGMPLSSSLDHVSRNLTGHPALAQELQILKRQAEVGSLKQALADFARRVDLPEVRQIANLLKRGEQLGTKMSSALLDQADHLRSTRRQTATLQANKTPVKLTVPILLCFAPAALILLISPAILELHSFFLPQDGQGVMAADDQFSASPGEITRTLDGLDQQNPTSSGDADYNNFPRDRYPQVGRSAGPSRPNVRGIRRTQAPQVGAD